MAEYYIDMESQSNGVFSHTPNYRLDLFRDTLNSIFAGLHTFQITADILNPGGPTPGSLMGGTAITNTTGTNGWIINDGIAANRASWAESTIGALGRTYRQTTISADRRTRCVAGLHFWSEYDSAQNNAASSAEILATAIDEYYGTRIRETDYGKTPAQMPIVLFGPMLYQPANSAGMRMVDEAFDMLVAMSGRNYHRFPCLIKDLLWDRDGNGDGVYSSHATDADLDVLMRRLGRYFARLLGPSLGLTDRFSGLGPKIQWVQYVDATTLDVWVQHDGGSDLVLGTNTNTALAFTLWNILISGQRVLPTAVAVPTTGDGAGRRVRLTMPTMPGPKAVQLKHGHWIQDFAASGTMYQRGGLQAGVYDNSDTWQSAIDLILPASFTGTNRVPMPIRELRTYMQARLGPPPTA